MELNEYQSEALRTSGGFESESPLFRLLTSALSLCGEAGEFGNLVKKQARHGHDVPIEKLVDELGDVLWYVADLASAIGVDLDHVARLNVAKLRARYPDGFSQEASKNRTL
jgi:NTP pyrophosphatase (non-canonical NTP hydrolase)